MPIKVPKSKTLPYYSSKSTLDAIKTGSKIRQTNSLLFLMRKIKNYIFFMIAYFCPVNSIRVGLHKLRGVNIGNDVYIGMGCVIDHAYPEYVIIEDNVCLTGNVYIVAHSKPSDYYMGVFKSYVSPVILKKNVFVGVNVTVTSGVEVAGGCFISAGSTLFNSFNNKNTLIRGNPAEEVLNFNKE